MVDGKGRNRIAAGTRCRQWFESNHRSWVFDETASVVVMLSIAPAALRRSSRLEEEEERHFLKQ